MTPYDPPSGPLNLLYEDAYILALNKPSGLLSVPGRGPEKADCLAARVQAQFSDALIVHRLDMETSGVIVMARSTDMQRALSTQFEKRALRKHYIARVEGCVDAETGEIDLPLIKDWPNRPRQKICHETGKPSLTRWRIIRRARSTTRLELTPLTGRSHQLRLHLASIGHPILGDTLYGDASTAPRLQLHASALELTHPDSQKLIRFQADCPF